MICIAYLSTAIRPPSAAELAAILGSSRRRNADQGVTGLLCHHDGSFLQFLEGEEAAVEEVYGRIAGDRRHHSLLRIQTLAISQRLFPEWAMAIVTPQSLGARNVRFCRALRELDVGTSDEHVRAIKPILASFRGWLR